MSDMQMQLERSLSASGEGGKVAKEAFKGLMQVFSVGEEGDASLGLGDDGRWLELWGEVNVLCL